MQDLKYERKSNNVRIRRLASMGDLHLRDIDTLKARNREITALLKSPEQRAKDLANWRKRTVLQNQLKTERADILDQIRTMAESDAAKDALEKRLAEITPRIRVRAPDTRVRSARKREMFKDEKYLMRKKTKSSAYTDPFLSDVDTFYDLSTRLPATTPVPRLSPTFLRQFGWTG